MRIMTQYATQHMQTIHLVQDIQSQEISLLVLQDSSRFYPERIAQVLEERGQPCSWIWYPDASTGSETGTAFLCMERAIRCVDRFPINKGTALGVQIDGLDDWFYCLSLDPEVEDNRQWQQINGCIAAKRLCSTVWLLGIASCRKKIPRGNWVEIADGKIWCSRIQEGCFCAGNQCKKPCTYIKDSAVTDVKE